jgi:hypothetical protein
VIVDGIQKARPGSKVSPSVAPPDSSDAKAGEKAEVKAAEPKPAAAPKGK